MESESNNKILSEILQDLNINIIPKNIAIFKNNQIIELFLNRIGILTIPNGFFENPFFKTLRILHLNSNKLINLPSNIFMPLKKLEFLSIRKNLLFEFKNEYLKGLINLKEIDLSNNLITSLDDNAFNLETLEIINLKNNHISNLPLTLFENNNKIKDLNLSINLLNEIPEAIKNLPIEKLNLSNNLIPNMFAKNFLTKSVVSGFLSEFNEYLEHNYSEPDIPEELLRQYIFNQLMAVYQFIVNSPVLQHSILNLAQSFMVKNFHMLVNQINLDSESSPKLDFRQTIFLWKKLIYIFNPVEQELIIFLDENEDENERRRRELERNQIRMKEIEIIILENGGILDFELSKTDTQDVDFEDHVFYNLIKKFWTWNAPHLSKLFL